MESLVKLCFKATLTGVGGYMLGGLAVETQSLTDAELKTNKDIIRMNYLLERNQKMADEFEEDTQDTKARLSKSSI